MAFHNKARYTGDKSILKHIADGQITESDGALIAEYVAERQATRHISEGRAHKITFCLVGWRRFITVPYTELTTAELYKGITAMKNGKSDRGRPFKQNTVHDNIILLKPFLLWLKDAGLCEIPDKKLAEIHAPGTDFNTARPEELITKDEILKLIEACDNSRDRALIATHYETAARPAETAALTWKDVNIDEYGAEIRILDQKKAHLGHNYRYAYLTWSRAYLAAWKNDYKPGKPDDDSSIFVTSQGNEINYNRFRRIIDKAKSGAGINKKITPHLFRKSRITHMLAEGFSETIVKKIAWDNVSTGMIRTYTKLSETDIRNEVLDRAGIIQKSESAPPILPRTCYKCGTQNSPTARFCTECSTALTDDAREEQEVTVSSAISDLDGDQRLNALQAQVADLTAKLEKLMS